MSLTLIQKCHSTSSQNLCLCIFYLFNVYLTLDEYNWDEQPVLLASKTLRQNSFIEGDLIWLESFVSQGSRECQEETPTEHRTEHRYRPCPWPMTSPSPLKSTVCVLCAYLWTLSCNDLWHFPPNSPVGVSLSHTRVLPADSSSFSHQTSTFKTNQTQQAHLFTVSHV